MKNEITKTKLNLIQKIVNARLTPAELQLVTNKAKSIIKSRNAGKDYAKYNLVDQVMCFNHYISYIPYLALL